MNTTAGQKSAIRMGHTGGQYLYFDPIILTIYTKWFRVTISEQELQTETYKNEETTLKSRHYKS
jgi:hypothetical protein